MKILNTALFVAILIGGVGCATIVSKSRYPVVIATEPTGAKIEVKDQDGVVRFSGMSPTTAMLDASQGYFTRARYTVVASREGYSTATYPLQSSVDGWYWANILFGGVIGMLLVDPVSGAMYQIDTPVANLNLPRDAAAVRMTSGRSRTPKGEH